MTWSTFLPAIACMQPKEQYSEVKEALLLYDEIYIQIPKKDFETFIPEWEEWLDPSCVGMFAEIMKPIEYDRDVINLIEKLAQADLDDEEMMNVFKHIDPTGEKDILHKEAIILSVLNYDLFTSYINKISYFPVKELIPIVEYKIKRETGASNIEAIMSKDIPSFANLHWSRIFQMREEGAMIDLRKKIIKASDKIQSDPRVITKTDISQIVDPALRNDLWSLVSDVKPNLASSVLMGIVSNYPTIFPIL